MWFFMGVQPYSFSLAVVVVVDAGYEEAAAVAAQYSANDYDADGGVATPQSVA